MQHLEEKWLRLINYYYVGFSLLFVAGYAYFAITQNTLKVTGVDQYGLSAATAAFAVACVLYNLIFKRFVRKYNIWIAYALSLTLFALANNAAVELALKSSGFYVFVFNNLFLVISSVALGPVTAIAALGLSGIVYAMTLAGTTTSTPLGKTGDGMALAFRFVAVGILLYVLRNKYVTDTNKENYIEKYFVTNEVVRLLTDSIGDGVIIIDQAGIIRSINPAALTLLSQQSKDVIELNYRSVLKLNNLNKSELTIDDEPVAKAIKTNKSVSQELLVLIPGKQEAYMDVTVSPIANPTNQNIYGAVIILRDVSKKKKEEAARSEFISTASHEMRTPVAAIEGFIELALNEKVSTIDERARKYLEKARNSTQHLGRLFQDLLVSAKAEDGRLSSHPTVIEMGELVEQQVELSKIGAQQKGLALEFVISSGKQATQHENLKVIKPLYYALADGDRMREVITNLVDNAIKYTPAGKITVGVTGNNEVVQFFVKDTGVGIGPDDIPHLFQKFYRVDSSATRTSGGTGLGLFICKKIVSLYNGSIWAESKLGQGTTFFVNLPRLTSTQAEATKAQQALQQAESNPPVA